MQIARKKIGTICVCCSTGSKSVTDWQTPTDTSKLVHSYSGGVYSVSCTIAPSFCNRTVGGFLCTNALSPLGESTTLPPFSKKSNTPSLIGCGARVKKDSDQQKWDWLARVQKFEQSDRRRILWDDFIANIYTSQLNFLLYLLHQKSWAVSYFHKTFFSQLPHSNK